MAIEPIHHLERRSVPFVGARILGASKRNGVERLWASDQQEGRAGLKKKEETSARSPMGRILRQKPPAPGVRSDVDCDSDQGRTEENT